jgi:hypothetical protein
LATDFLDLLEHDGVRLLRHPSLSHQYAALLPIIEEVSGPTHPATLTHPSESRALDGIGERVGFVGWVDFQPPRPVVGGVN